MAMKSTIYNLNIDAATGEVLWSEDNWQLPNESEIMDVHFPKDML